MGTANTGRRSGSFNPAAIAVIAICGITLGAAALREPGASVPPASATGAVLNAAADGDAGNLPAQIANQARDVELMPYMYE